MTVHRDGNEERGDSGADTRESRPPSTAERVTMAAGVALILGLAALVTSLTFFAGGGPPEIEATPLTAEVRDGKGLYYLPIAISNHGGQMAQDVLVIAAIVAGEDMSETAELTVDFLAAGETVERTAVFSANPEDGEISIDIASFN